MKKFEIYILDDTAVISEDLDKIDITALKQEVLNSEKYCCHCGRQNVNNTLNCEHCGSGEFTTKDNL